MTKISRPLPSACALVVWRCCFWTAPALAVDITLAWDANAESDLAGYHLYYRTCPAAGTCDGIGPALKLTHRAVPKSSLSDPAHPRHTLVNLPDNHNFVFVVTAYSTAGLESGYSRESSVWGRFFCIFQKNSVQQVGFNVVTRSVVHGCGDGSSRYLFGKKSTTGLLQ